MMLLANQGSYQFGDFLLNVDLRVLSRQGERVPLGSKTFDVLTCLVSRAGQVVTKPELFAAVWRDSFVEEGALSQQIFTLRKAFAEKADYIATVPGQGYRFMGEVRRLPPNPPSSTAASWDIFVQETHERRHTVIEEPMPVGVAASHRAGGVHRYALLAASVVGAALLVARWTWSHRSPPPDHLTVVLADFINNTGDPTFDRTLNRALEIDLEQSPYMEVLSESDSAETLQEMGRKKDIALTTEVAREICVRNNRQALLTGSISRVGDDYLLTVEATACGTGKRLASAKAETANKAKVLGAMDSLADRVRSRLGESAKSIQGYDVPIEDAATPSLEALKAYSVGKYMQAQGKPFSESLQLFQRAVELDPNFAQAYGEIANSYGNLGEPRLEAQYMQKCFDLRDRTGVKQRLMIQAHYYSNVQNDWPAALRGYEAWAARYPDDWVPWVDAANLYTQLGEFTPSIADALRALQLDRNIITYDVLGRAYKDTGRFAEAKALVQQAAREGKDSTTLHTFLLEIAFDEGDTVALAQEGDWLAAHKDSLHDYYAGEAAAMQGRYKLAEELFRREVATDRQEGLAELADEVAIEQAEMEREVGMTATAKATLDHLGKEVQTDPDFNLQHALLGDLTYAERFLAAHSKDAHPDTGLFHREVPQMRAAIAIHRSAARDAVTDLLPPNTLEWPHVSVLTQRGHAYLQAGQPDLAAKDFQFILDHPGAFFAVDRPLAHLGLARAYVAENNVPAARGEYQAFLAAWKDADPDLPVLKAARLELAKLP